MGWSLSCSLKDLRDDDAAARARFAARERRRVQKTSLFGLSAARQPDDVLEVSKYALHYFGSTCNHHHEIPLPSSRRRSGRCRLRVQPRQQQSYSVPRRHSAAALGDASGCVLHQCPINIVVPPTTNLLLQSASTALVSASQQQRQQWSKSIGCWVVPSKCV